MTRFERIAADLRQHGPSTTKEIAARFGWKMTTASAVVSHARSYGFIKITGWRPPDRVRPGWGAAAQNIFSAIERTANVP